MRNEIILAGFGGQGVLFAGKVLAYTGLMNGDEISWMPSYGPEMRGGTANCHVIASKTPVASPLITRPTTLIAMNLPSLRKFENTVVTGGTIIYDSSLITEKAERDDVSVCAIPATKMADDMNARKLANMIMLGAFFKQSEFTSLEVVMKGLAKCVPSSKAQLLEVNEAAILAGYNY